MKPARTWRDQFHRLLEPTNPYFIDIGSAVTKIICRGRLIYCEPTCLAVHKESGAVTALGQKAYALIGKNSSVVTVTFPIQRGAVASSEYFELYLQSLARVLDVPISAQRLLVGIGGAVGTTASLSAVNTEFLKTGLSRAGFARLQLVPKPMAVLQQRLKKTDDHPVGIVDIGGQLTEVSVCSAGEIVQSATLPWGGVQLTELVQQVVAAEYSCAIGWQAAEELKRATSWVAHHAKQGEKLRQTKYAVRGKDTASQTVKTVVVNAGVFETVFTEHFAELTEGLHDFFDEIPTELSTAVFNRGLILTGGGSLVRGLSESLGGVFECEVQTVDRPELDVVEGLAAGRAE